MQRDNKELKVVVICNDNEEIISGGNTSKVGLILLLSLITLLYNFGASSPCQKMTFQSISYNNLLHANNNQTYAQITWGKLAKR